MKAGTRQSQPDFTVSNVYGWSTPVAAVGTVRANQYWLRGIAVVGLDESAERVSAPDWPV